MSLRKITITPHGGLCNRLRVIASAKTLADDLQIKVDIRWVLRQECMAGFADLFKPVKISKLRIISPLTRDLPYRPSSYRNLWLAGTIKRLRFDKFIKDYYPEHDGNILDHLPASGHLHMATCCDVASHYPLKELFRPADDITAAIDSTKSRFGSYTIGVHIRRTDHEPAMQNNSIDDFKQKIAQEIIVNNAVNFYLATDDPEVKNELKEVFGDRIITHDAVLERTSVTGMKGAVAELWCLSGTKRIIGSYTSTYSEMAAELGGIELEII